MQIPADWKGGLFPHEQAREAQPKGIDVNVDLGVLLDRVYVAPQRPAWFKALVVRVMAKYGVETPVETSRLDERPDLT
jgi:hypothetical protein